MRIFFVLVYLVVMFYFLFRGFTYIFYGMTGVALVFIGCMPLYRDHSIKVAKKKILESTKARQQGQIVKPFIEINSSPWWVLAELPGVSKAQAKRAVQLRRENGAFPAMDVFLRVLNIKKIFFEHIKAVAYIKNEQPPINRNSQE